MNRKSILIVEDDKVLLKALRERFIMEGYDVLTAMNGKEGLEVSLSDHPQLILLDIVMPVMDGLAMLKQLREDEWGAKVPVVLLTNLNSAEKVAEALERRAFDFLVKSDWSLDDVVKKVADKIATK